MADELLNYCCMKMGAVEQLGVLIPFSERMFEIMSDYSGLGDYHPDNCGYTNDCGPGVYNPNCSYGTDICDIFAMGFYTLSKLYPEKYQVDMKNLPFHPYRNSLEQFDVVRLPDLEVDVITHNFNYSND